MKYNVGDKVRVKTWEELKSIWPKANYGDGLNVNKTYFNPEMKQYCGHVYTVHETRAAAYVLADDSGTILNWVYDYKTKKYQPWFFNNAMLEPAKEIPEPSLSFEDLLTR